MTDVLVNFILDVSGSMTPLKTSTQEGFNGFIHDQQNLEDRKCYLSLTLFDTTFDVRFVGYDVKEVADLGSRGNPHPSGGGTALYDAIGTCIKGAERWLDNNAWFSGKVVTVILTDGEENSSVTWHCYDEEGPIYNVEDEFDVNNLIRYKQGEGWEFIYMGSGPGSWSQSRAFATSIGAQATFNYVGDAVTTGASYHGLSSAVGGSRTYGSSTVSNANQTTNSMAQSRVEPPGTPHPTVPPESKPRSRNKKN